MALARAAGPPTRVGHLAQQAHGGREFLRMGLLVQDPARRRLLGQDPIRFRPGPVVAEARGTAGADPPLLPAAGLPDTVDSQNSFTLRGTPPHWPAAPTLVASREKPATRRVISYPALIGEVGDN